MNQTRTIGASLAAVVAMTYGGLAHAIPSPGAVADAYLEAVSYTHLTLPTICSV